MLHLLVETDLLVVEDTGSTFEVERTDGRRFHILAFETDRPITRVANQGGYALRGEVVGAPIYGDGVRVVWDTDHLRVYLDIGPYGSTGIPMPETVRRLATASLRLPYPLPMPVAPHCPRDARGTTLQPAAGAPGTVVTVSGPTLRDENRSWAPGGRIDVSWNTPRSRFPVVLTELPMRVARLVPGYRCYFSVTFRIPEVPRGTYPILVEAFTRGEILPEDFRFRVTE